MLEDPIQTHGVVVEGGMGALCSGGGCLSSMWLRDHVAHPDDTPRHLETEQPCSNPNSLILKEVI